MTNTQERGELGTCNRWPSGEAPHAKNDHEGGVCLSWRPAQTTNLPVDQGIIKPEELSGKDGREADSGVAPAVKLSAAPLCPVPAPTKERVITTPRKMNLRIDGRPASSPEYFATGYTREDLQAMHPDIKLKPEKLIGVTVPGAVEDRLEQIGMKAPAPATPGTPKDTCATCGMEFPNDFAFMEHCSRRGHDRKIWAPATPAAPPESGVAIDPTAIIDHDYHAHTDDTDRALWNSLRPADSPVGAPQLGTCNWDEDGKIPHEKDSHAEVFCDRWKPVGAPPAGTPPLEIRIRQACRLAAHQYLGYDHEGLPEEDREREHKLNYVSGMFADAVLAALASPSAPQPSANQARKDLRKFAEQLLERNPKTGSWVSASSLDYLVQQLTEFMAHAPSAPAPAPPTPTRKPTRLAASYLRHLLEHDLELLEIEGGTLRIKFRAGAAPPAPPKGETK